VPVTADTDDGFTIGTFKEENEIAQKLGRQKNVAVVTYAQERFLQLMSELTNCFVQMSFAKKFSKQMDYCNS